MSTKTVKIGGRDFEIPENMTVAGMVECWEQDSKNLEKVVEALSGMQGVGHMIARRYCQLKGYYLVPKNDSGDENE